MPACWRRRLRHCPLSGSACTVSGGALRAPTAGASELSIRAMACRRSCRSCSRMSRFDSPLLRLTLASPQRIDLPATACTLPADSISMPSCIAMCSPAMLSYPFRARTRVCRLQKTCVSDFLTRPRPRPRLRQKQFHRRQRDRMLQARQRRAHAQQDDRPSSSPALGPIANRDDALREHAISSVVALARLEAHAQRAAVSRVRASLHRA